MIFTQRGGKLSRHLSGYVRASTDNPTGWRPDYQRLGDLTRGPARMRPRLLGDDGDCDATFPETGICVNPNTGQVSNTPTDADISTKANAISQKFIDLNSAMTKNEADISALNQAGVNVSDLGTAALNQRKSFESYLSQYNTAYSMAFGRTPTIPGLQGLGMDPATAVIVAALLAALFAALVILYQNVLNTSQQVQVQKQQAQTQSTLANQLPALQKQYTDAVARGDSATANTVAQQISGINQNISAISGGGGGGGSEFNLSSFFGGLSTGTIALLVVGGFFLLKK